MAPILPQTKDTPYIPASNGGVLRRFSDNTFPSFSSALAHPWKEKVMIL